MATCRSCEKELAEDANFCPNCGLRTEKGENDNVRTPVDRRPDWEKDLDTAIQNAGKLLEEAVEAAKKGLKQVSEEVKTEIDKAKEMYERIIFEYPSSIYLVEARKAFRRLRGDDL